jgi:Glycine zipper
MNSKNAATIRVARFSRNATIVLAGALALVTMNGCFASPRANDTLGGAALGAGAGALLGGAEGSPATGALIGGLGGGAVGYLVGTEMYHGGYYRGGY